MAGEHRFDIRRHGVAHIRHGERFRRIVAPAGAARHPIAGADGEEEFGCRGAEGNDAVSGRGEEDRVAGIVNKNPVA